MMVDSSRGPEPAVFHAALAALSDGVTITDAEGELRYLNDAAARMLGAADAVEALALPMHELGRRCDVFDERGAQFDLAGLLPGGEVTVRIRCRGEDRWTQVTTTQIAGQAEASAALLFVHTFRDVTSLKAETETLKEQLEALITDRDARARFVDHFISVVGHDLRSPLSAIIMATALLGKVPLEERGARALVRIQSSSKRAERLIKDLTDFARARLGKGIALQRTDIDLHAIAQQIIEEVRLSNGERKVALSLVGDPCGSWDGDRMCQVMANLVSTAIKHSPTTTEVRVEIDGDDHEVRLIVHHLGGVGIEPEQLSRVFEPFVGAESTTATKGDGLTLYIVGEIVRAHGGTVEARSSTDEGTTLIAHLPR